MFAIIGIVIVLGAIAAGYTMEHGNFKVLMQPAELVIIFGAAVGTVVIANPLPTLIKIGKGLAGVFGGSPFTKAFYLESLKMLYELFALSRKAGTAKLEEEVDNPSKGQVFNKYPKFVKNHHALHFLCDTLRMAVSGGVDAMEIDTMMEIDLDVHHTEAAKPIAALSTMADALPGLGIVAAVLGVVITMGSLGGPPEEIGEKVAAALVGTFLGILLCYGVAGPLSSNMAKTADEHNDYLHVLRVLMLAFLKGSAPMIAIELGRRAIPARVRPTFDEMEKFCKGQGGAAAAPAKAA
jgi:chemotaxis protein MotA